MLIMFWRKKKQPEKSELPPNQSPTPGILRWGIDHPGITHDLPNVTKEEWELTVDGEVESPINYSWINFQTLPQVEIISNFHCVEGWSVLNQRWGGVCFRNLTKQVKQKTTAMFALFTCYDGYTTSMPLSELQGDDIILAHRLNGEDLSQPLGGPVRLVVPEKYAYKSAMWLNKITFLTRDRLGFWERSGYSNTADPWENDRYKFL
jgi:DMSO/TMAO reductase YedYZ molybdopterin-dependent catalytic subunit